MTSSSLKPKTAAPGGPARITQAPAASAIWPWQAGEQRVDDVRRLGLVLERDLDAGAVLRLLEPALAPAPARSHSFIAANQEAAGRSRCAMSLPPQRWAPVTGSRSPSMML